MSVVSIFEFVGMIVDKIIDDVSCVFGVELL